MPDTIVLDDLPDDIIVDKILILLPPKDVGRCRIVCRSWRSATSTPEFMLQHCRRQPSLPIIGGQDRPSSLFVLHGAGASRQQLWPFSTPKLKGGRCNQFCCDTCLHASCDGFIIVSQGARFYICNPTIRQYALLPCRYQPWPTMYVDQSCVHGLYQHKPTGEYRVLWSRLTNQATGECKEEAMLHVLTVGDNELRRINLILPSSSPPPSPKQAHQLSLALSRFSSLAHHHSGNLHWPLSSPFHVTGSTGDIVVFDTEAESFRWMSSPAHEAMWKRFFDMEGMLAFLSNLIPGTPAISIWVMQDYETQIWSFKHRIDVSTVQASRSLGLTSPEEQWKKKKPFDSTVSYFYEMVVLNEHELLMGFNDKNVLCYDTDGKFLRMFTIGKRIYRINLTSHRLQESIMPIPSSEMQEDEFPYSIEHV